MTDPLASAATKLVGDIVKEEVTGFVRKAKVWIKSSNVMIIGQERSGKTSFYRYLLYDLKRPEQHIPITALTESSGATTVKVGERLQATVRNYYDVPGQISPTELAEKVGRAKPRLLVVFLNARLPFKAEETGQYVDIYKWVDAFFGRLGEIFRTKKGLSGKIRDIIVVVNKIDVLYDTGEIERFSNYQEVIRGLACEHLQTSMGTKMKDLLVLPCCTVVNSSRPHQQDDKLMKLLVEEIILKLQNTKRIEL